MKPPVRAAIVGATGAVGSELLAILEQRQFPLSDLRLLASSRSAGRVVVWKGEARTVEPLDGASFEGVDVAFFSAGAERSREYAPIAVSQGALVIDNSSAFRMDREAPLVVPEINARAMNGARLIANPNCTAIILCMALAPLSKLATIKRVVASTYQSASGAGAQAMQELLDQTADYLAGRSIEPRIMPHPYAFNLFSHNTAIGEDGYNGEEAKVIEESRKILSMPELALTVTCVRVPVLRAHSISVNVEFDRPVDESEAREVLLASQGVRVVDDREHNLFPMPSEASGQDETLVGRIRQDNTNANALNLFVCGDQLRKGAALNAVQIAEALMSR
ncbi:MAG: aspartate-semialdehyde dehydrogenase [Armatimonadetes bacterium]|nr:aspartate-semialdehyde dehydrogenase [Armatimonadota bacterium]